MRTYNRTRLNEYPCWGTFYTSIEERKPDGNLLDNEQPEPVVTSSETIIFERECDILQASKMFNSGAIVSDYDVFFPTKKGENLPIRPGISFRCLDYPIPVHGMVIGIDATQMGCKVQIKMSDV